MTTLPGPFSHQNRFLLYVEMQLISVVSAAALAYALRRLSPTQPEAPFVCVFGALSGTSAVVLGITLAAAAQKRQKIMLSCRFMFHLPFAVAILYGAASTLVFQILGPLRVALAVLGTVAAIAVACKILDGFYNNMVGAVARDNDEDGVIILHHVCRQVTRLFWFPSMAHSQHTRISSKDSEEVALLDESDTGDKHV